jgi:tRNA (cytidine56-2'-O)-methyltransferase
VNAGVEAAILRLGHRPERDQRVTTHVGLTARALGAQGMYLAAADKGIVESIQDVTLRWGGDFFVQDSVKWKRCIADWKKEGGIVVHLTMYGLSLTAVEEEIRGRGQDVLIVVGAEKVPKEIYRLADYNVAVTGQPHSEISSLAIFLDHLFCGTRLGQQFPDARIRVIPCACGKKTGEL